MTPAGWVFLIVSWLAILGLCVFCLDKLFVRRRRG